MYKNQLQELAQRSCFNLPSYACIREGPDHAPRFKATVNFNGEAFESPTFCSTLRQAEHAAAEVALNVLSKKGPSKALAARVLDETGVYKNLLQETAHRAGLKLPFYTTVRSGPGHVPVFSCTVELAGMSFTGELAKTKKQAQKNAAMTAWFALKRLSTSGSSSSASSPLSDSLSNEEQEQVTVARYLATLKPPEAHKTKRRDWHHGRGSSSSQSDVISYGSDRSLYSLQHQNWVCSQFSPEVPIYQTWPQNIVSQQQSHLLALSSSLPTFPPRSPIFPFIQSMFQPDPGQFFLAQEQEPVSLVPGMDQFLYFSSHAMHVPLRSVSQVTLKEIEENSQGEQEWLNGEGTNFSLNASRHSPVDSLNSLVSVNSHSEQKTQELTQEEGEENNKGLAPNTGNSTQLESNQTKHYNWISPGFVDARSRPMGISTVKFQLQNPHTSNYSQSNIQPQSPPVICSPGSVRGFLQDSFAAPVKVRTVGAVSSCSLTPENQTPLVHAPGLRPKNSNPRMHAPPPARLATSACSTRPWLEGMRNIGGMPSSSFMAPAVHIRSVVPVCSAPPVKTQIPSPSQEGPFSGVEKEMTEESGRNVTAACSDFGKLQI
ncbi:dsrm domain-containing protein [Cephalotus follicularis]|uniref:Dsrm domain-containing protein n=1 Tax=Cephalotus follicularis TaxID=3775 RepID=A0A1Q3D512_CEPFO|nr:dsrm domain-containing protein [Cephalotus follicularis]